MSSPITQARELPPLDAIAHIGARCAGRLVVTGFHGGASAAGCVLEAPATPHAVFVDNAGVGKEGAGIVAPATLQQRAIAAAANRRASGPSTP